MNNNKGISMFTFIFLPESLTEAAGLVYIFKAGIPEDCTWLKMAIATT